MGKNKKFVVEIDEKYVDQRKHQVVTYIIGKAYDKKCLRRNIKKKLSDVDRQKKVCKQQKLYSPPPPDIKWYVPQRLLSLSLVSDSLHSAMFKLPVYTPVTDTRRTDTRCTDTMYTTDNPRIRPLASMSLFVCSLFFLF